MFPFHNSFSFDCIQWVPVIAGLVHKKIFSVKDSQIDSRTEHILEETVAQIINNFPTEVVEERLQDFVNYQPFEDSYLSSDNLTALSSSALLVESTNQSNPHFSYNSKGPNFMERELKIMEERKARDQTLVVKKNPQLGPLSSSSTVSSHALSSSGVSNRATTNPSSSLRSSFIQPETKKSAKTLSDAMVLSILFFLFFSRFILDSRN